MYGQFVCKSHFETKKLIIAKRHPTTQDFDGFRGHMNCNGVPESNIDKSSCVHRQDKFAYHALICLISCAFCSPNH